MYPCTWGCQEPLSTAWNVKWQATFDPPGDESANPNTETIDLTNTSSQRIDASYRVVTFLGYVLEMGPGSYVDPGETLRVHVGRGSETRLHKYLNHDRPALANAGGSVLLRNTEGVQIGCARWGDGGPTAYRCSPTPTRQLDAVEVSATDYGQALRLAVIPGGARTYRVQRWQGDGWAQVASGTTGATGRVDVPLASGRYRVVVPAQAGYASRTSAAVDLVARVALKAQAEDSTVAVHVLPSDSGGSWAVTIERSASGAWDSVASGATDSAGWYRVSSLAAGTYRAVVAPAHGFAGATSGSVVVTAPLTLSATLSTVSGKVGALRVNVNPNRAGDLNWWFDLERQSTAGWSRVGTYSTRGWGEVRDFTYRSSGTYRVSLPSQSGAGGRVSAPFAYTAPRATLSVSVVDSSRLAIDAGPSLPGGTNFALTIQKRSGSTWVRYRTISTAGTSERVTADVTKGYYRVVLPNQRGYLGARSTTRYVAR